MKTFLNYAIVCLGLLISVMSGAQSPYRVFSVSGAVTVTDGAGTRPLEKRDGIKLSDKINIPDGAAVRILDSSSGIIYNATAPGTRRLKQIVDEGAAASKTVIGAVNSQLAREKQTRKDAPGRVIGATSRGPEVDAAIERIVKKVLNIARSEDTKTITGSGSLYLTEIPEGDCVHLQIMNADSQVQAAAVFAVCESCRSVRSVLPQAVLAAPGSTELKEPLLVRTPDVYLLVVPVDESIFLPDLAIALSRQLFR